MNKRGRSSYCDKKSNLLESIHSYTPSKIPHTFLYI